MNVLLDDLLHIAHVHSSTLFPGLELRGRILVLILLQPRPEVGARVLDVALELRVVLAVRVDQVPMLTSRIATDSALEDVTEVGDAQEDVRADVGVALELRLGRERAQPVAALAQEGVDVAAKLGQAMGTSAR